MEVFGLGLYLNLYYSTSQHNTEHWLHLLKNMYIFMSTLLYSTHIRGNGKIFIIPLAMSSYGDLSASKATSSCIFRIVLYPYIEQNF